MQYQELYQMYVTLKKENEVLKNENKKMRELLGSYGGIVNTEDEIIISEEIEDYGDKIPIITEDNQIGKVSNMSTPKEKIHLFMSLFKGREDVYAKRFEKKDGKGGYSPVYMNEWKKWICNKPKIKCSQCENRKYSVLSFDEINRHLRGIEVLGIYPMLEDEKCFFLAIDFDDDGWEKDVTIIREVCEEKNIPFAVERSRSGNGAHVWFFFNESISAVIARKFGTAILTYAMDKRHEIKFKSYDRLFPNQDTMPKGGLGNLIALPLQKNSRENNNSVFIDENFEPYSDQWLFYLQLIRYLKKI